jgi:hypothetical protein
VLRWNDSPTFRRFTLLTNGKSENMVREPSSQTGADIYFLMLRHDAVCIRIYSLFGIYGGRPTQNDDEDRNVILRQIRNAL